MFCVKNNAYFLKYMKKYMLLLLLFSLSMFCVNGQSIHEKLKQMYRTIDYLYLNDTLLFMLNKSPLSVLNKFDSVYAEFGYCSYESDFVIDVPDKNYQAAWIVINDELYLFDIVNDCDVRKLLPLKYMEKFLNLKFSKSKVKYYIQQSKTVKQGVIPAVWFSDTLYIKKCPSDLKGWDYYETYDYRLIFYKGRLLQAQKVKPSLMTRRK